MFQNIIHIFISDKNDQSTKCCFEIIILFIRGKKTLQGGLALCEKASPIVESDVIKPFVLKSEFNFTSGLITAKHVG